MNPVNDEIVEAILHAKSIAVLTGAGISVESGIPTFRDAMSGLWAKFNPEELATPQAFHRDPAIVSRWYDERRCTIAACKPNAGHLALARLQSHAIARQASFTLITQNVDRLHQAAGSSNVVELHGTLWVWRCLTCGAEAEERGPAFGQYPVNCACGGLRRPGVVWFGESLPPAALAGATRAARSCDLFMSIGTSSVVYPAAGLIDDALEAGAKVLELNPQQTPFSGRATWSIRGAAGQVLRALVEPELQD